MTKRLSLGLTVTLSLTAAACTYSPRMPAEGQASRTQSGSTKGTLLVRQLPAGVEGLALVNGELKVQAGYEFAKGDKGTFTVARAGGGQVTSGGCGCSGAGDCDPVLSPDGIIVCQSNGCTTSCGLAVTIAGTRTELIRY